MSKQPYINQSTRDEHEKAVNAKRSLIMGWNSDDLEAYKIKVNSDGSLASPLPTQDLNGAMSISKSVVGTVTTTTINKTIGDKTYRQTIVSDSADGSVEISAWSEV